MTIKCYICKRDINDEDVNDDEPEKSKCNQCHVKWLQTNISHLTSSLAYMKLELNAILSKNFVYSDSESDDDDEYEYPIVNGQTLEGCKAYDSDDNYLDNNTN
jgi:hypothetical protein